MSTNHIPGPVGHKSNTSDLDHKDQPRRGGTQDDLDRNMAAMKSELDGLKSRVEDFQKAGQDADLAAVPATVDGLKADLAKVQTAMEKVDGDYTDAVKALTTRLDGLDNAMDLNAAAAQVKSYGDMIMDTEGFKSAHFDASGGRKKLHLDSADPIYIPRITGAKATITPISLTQMGDAVPNFYRPGIFTEAQDVMNLAARLMRISVPNATTYSVRKETAASLTGYITTTLAVTLDGDPTPKTVATFTDVDGFVPGTYVRFWNASGALLARLPIVSIDTGTKVVTFATDAIDFDATAGWRITGENFGAVAESADKPYGFLEVDVTDHSMKTIPTLMAVTNQVLDSVAGMTSWIELKLRARFLRNLSWHLLKGDGSSAQQLAGFDNASGAQTFTWSTDGVAGDFRADAIFRAGALIPWSGAIVVVMNRADLVKLQLEKNSTDGAYVQSQMFGGISLNMFGPRMFLGPYEIILDDACVEGDFYMINLSEASELADAERASLAWGYVNAQFAQNQITARYEERLLHAINSTAAFVLGEWDSAPS